MLALALADDLAREICRTSSTCQVAAWPAEAGHRHGPLVPGPVWQGARWLEEQLGNSSITARTIHYQEKEAGPAVATSRAHCLLVLGLAMGLVPAVDDLMPADQGNRVIGQAISVVQANPAIGPVTSVVQADRVIDPVTSADLAAPAIDPAILVALANLAEILLRICQVASATGRDGRTGARSTVTISETGGKTIEAILTIGLTTPGGMTITSTGPTTQASVIGVGPLGRHSRVGSIMVGLIRSITTTAKTSTTKMAPSITVINRYARSWSTHSKPRQLPRAFQKRSLRTRIGCHWVYLP